MENLKHKGVKQNITIPLEEDTIKKAEKLVEEKGFKRTEILRFAIDYAFNSPHFKRHIEDKRNEKDQEV